MKIINNYMKYLNLKQKLADILLILITILSIIYLLTFNVKYHPINYDIAKNGINCLNNQKSFDIINSLSIIRR